MTYVAWAVLYEGGSDAAYYDVLIPRVMEELALAGNRLPTIPTTPAIRLKRANINEVAAEACAAKDAFHILFIHADTGGRGLEAGIARRSDAFVDAAFTLCGIEPELCVVIAPRHETEAWILADSSAVTSSLGYTGSAGSLGLPASAGEAERLVDPKAVLANAVQIIRGRRKSFEVSQIFPAIAQRQRLAELRRTASFRQFEGQLRTALTRLHAL
ncbi:MAG: hypothetical protein ACOH1H_09565 [Brevundimonas sp.]